MGVMLTVAVHSVDAYCLFAHVSSLGVLDAYLKSPKM